MPFSELLYDTQFNLAHLLKKLSYILVLIGLLNSLYLAYTALQAEMEKRQLVENALRESHKELQKSNIELAQFSQQMKESEKRFRTLANAAPTLIWTAGKNKSCDWFNDTWLNYTGRSIEQECLNDWSESVHPDDLENSLDIFSSHFDEHQPFQMEYRLRGFDGIYRWFINVGRPRFDEHGEFFGYIGMLIDVDKRKADEEIVERERKNLFTILESLPGFVYLQAQDYSIRYANRYFRERFGDPTHVRCYESLCGRDKPCEECPTFRVFDDQIPQVWEASGTRDGKIYQVYDYPISDHNGESLVLELGLDITDRKKSEEALRLSASVFAYAQESIMITDADCKLVDVNAAFTRDTGYQREEVLGLNPRLLKSGYQGDEFYHSMWETIQKEGHWSGELWNRTKLGEVYAELLTVTAVCDSHGKVTHYVGISADITHLKQHQQTLEHLAQHDALTGLPNRVLLADRIHQAISQARRNKQSLALCYLDLDGFKLINDTMGHDAGDLVLIEVSKRINATIRGGDTAARLGGDEFAILLLELNLLNEYQLMLQRLLKTISQPIDISGKQISVGASIGVSFFPNDSEDPDTLLRQADQAMYQAKKSGKNQYRLYQQ